MGVIESVVFLQLPRQLEAEDRSEQLRKQKNQPNYILHLDTNG